MIGSNRPWGTIGTLLRNVRNASRRDNTIVAWHEVPGNSGAIGNGLRLDAVAKRPPPRPGGDNADRSLARSA